MSTIEKKIPQSPEEFKSYILEYCKPTIGFDSHFEKYYKINVQSLIINLESSAFWREFLTGLDEIDTKYRKDNNDLDLIHLPINQLRIKDKPVSSVIDKAFRQSIIENETTFDSADYYKGFVLPENVFEKLNDIIRTEIIVKYLDGIDLIGDYIENLAKRYNYEINKKYLSKDEGYYALHLYISYNAEISDFQGAPRDKEYMRNSVKNSASICG